MYLSFKIRHPNDLTIKVPCRRNKHDRGEGSLIPVLWLQDNEDQGFFFYLKKGQYIATQTKGKL